MSGSSREMSTSPAAALAETTPADLAVVAALCSLRANYIAPYSPAERRAALQRFREKKKRRSAGTAIRYQVRKKLAEKRPRHRGRFSKRETGSLSSPSSIDSRS